MSQNWIPRLEQAEMPSTLVDYLQPRVQRLGYLGEMFKVGANTPAVLLKFCEFTDALKEAVRFDISETVVLTVARVMGNDYERNQHERLCMRNGLSADWLLEVENLDPKQAKLMSQAQRAAQAFAIQTLQTRGHDNQAQFEALAEHFDPAQAVSIAFLVGRYFTHALIVNTMRLAPPVPSVFDDGFKP